MTEPTRWRTVVLAMAGVWVVVLAVSCALRWFFPLELEWMEGGSLHQALRWSQGESMYPQPSPAFVPFLYTPLYAWVLAGLGWVLPLDFAVARAVSIAAAVAVGFGLWRLVGAEGKPRAHQAAAVGLWCAGYGFCYRWYDVARGDSLALALMLWGVVVLRSAGGRPSRAVVAGVLVAAAFWTKQTAAVLIVASGVAGLWADRRALPWYVATVAAVVGAGLWLGQATTGGYLWYYIYELHQQHAFNAVRFTRKTWGMFGHAAPFLVGLVAWRGVAWLRGWVAKREQLTVGGGYWGVLAVAGLLVSALGYSTQWAETNAFMPGVCFAAAFIAVILPTGRGEALALAVVAAQLLFALVIEPRYQSIQDRGIDGLTASYAWQDPWRTIPQAAAWAQAAALRRELIAEEGEILALQRPWWSILAGGPGHVGSMGLNDVLPAERRVIEQALIAKVVARQFTAVYLDGQPPRWLRSALARHYTLERSWQGSARVLPMTGYMSVAGMVTPWTGPQLKYRRRGEPVKQQSLQQ